MSITSMSNRARLAQELSIPQLQQSIQDGVIPSYIGVPLLQEKVKDAKLLQAAKAAQNAMPHPSVAQQIMSEAQQVEQGVPSLPTNLPQAMAGGGIVAFADGGMYDEEDDTDEDRQEAERMSAMEDAMDEYQQVMANAAPYAVEKEGKDSYQAVRVSPKGGEFEALALEKNKAHGVDERLLKHVMHKETGGMKDRAHAVSSAGAQGVMQLMPATAKSLGVKDAFDPEQNIEGGVKFLAQLERKYKDPKLAAMAYNWGPGNVDKWLMAGADMSKLPKETRNYVQGLAQGGEVKHFEAGGFNPYSGEFEYDDVKRELLGEKVMRAGRAAKDYLADAMSYEKGLTAGEDMPGMAQAKEKVAAALAARNAKATPLANIQRGHPTMQNDPRLYGGVQKEEASQDAIDAADNLSIDKMLSAYKPASQGNAAATTSQTPASPYAKFEELFARREANLEKQREQDKAMAILQAGLGMMGGTSPYAAANIGAGASQGLQSLAQANAQRTAEENALLSGRLGLAKIGSSKDYQDAMIQLRKELAGQTNERLKQSGAAALEEKQAARLGREQQRYTDMLANISKNAEIAAEKELSTDPKNLTLTDAQRAAKKQLLISDILRRSKGYVNAYKGAYGPEADPFEALGGGASTSDNAGWSITPTKPK